MPRDGDDRPRGGNVADGMDIAPAGETDADLLVYMAMASDDPPVAREAWDVFYRRHVGYLYAVCRRSYARWLGGEAGVGDLVADTFKRAFEHAGTFDAEGVTDADRLRRRVRAWLGRIAQRLMQTALREAGRLPLRYAEPENWAELAPEPVDGPGGETGESVGPEVAAAREAMALLTEAEQTVLRVTLQWYRPERDHQRLPNDVAEDLARTLGTTPENLRQIRRRALRKVKQHVEEIMRREQRIGEDEP